METDYLDDPKRPGAVLGPRTIAKRTNELGKLLQMPEDEEVKVGNMKKYPNFFGKFTMFGQTCCTANVGD